MQLSETRITYITRLRVEAVESWYHYGNLPGMSNSLEIDILSTHVMACVT